MFKREKKWRLYSGDRQRYDQLLLKRNGSLGFLLCRKKKKKTIKIKTVFYYVEKTKV